MHIEFINNASFLFTFSNGRTVLTDPWYFDGSYYGAWYNFPPLAEFERQRYLSLKPDYIYISHLHPDHLDLRTLRQYPKDTPILVGKLPHEHLTRKIRSAGFSHIVEIPVGERVPVDGFEATIFDAFSSTSENVDNAVNYAIDTSLLLKDSDGTVVFNNVDNTIQLEDARRIGQAYGHLDVAILPYCGGSMYPHTFAQYTHSDKMKRRDELCERMLARFLNLAEAINARMIVPAAGSYVLGGSIADYTQYLHQATPQQIKDAWNHGKPGGVDLRLMYTGDVLDAHTGDLAPNPEALYRDFDAESRLEYARKSRAQRLAHEEIVLPSAFDIPWDRLIKKARHNLWAQQQRLDIYPPYNIFLTVENIGSTATTEGQDRTWVFPLAANEIRAAKTIEDGPEHTSMIAFRVDSRLLVMLFLGGAIWNNAEIASLIRVDKREPDVFSPTIHSLMSYFTL